mgnify:CR=1 FL=1
MIHLRYWLDQISVVECSLDPPPDGSRCRRKASSRSIQPRLAAFCLDGRPLVAFGAAVNHCAFYPMSGSTVEAHRDALKDYDTSKGAIRFQPDKPLPTALVRKLVKARIAENRDCPVATQYTVSAQRLARCRTQRLRIRKRKPSGIVTT